MGSTGINEVTVGTMDFVELGKDSTKTEDFAVGITDLVEQCFVDEGS